MVSSVDVSFHLYLSSFLVVRIIVEGTSRIELPGQPSENVLAILLNRQNLSCFPKHSFRGHLRGQFL